MRFATALAGCLATLAAARPLTGVVSTSISVDNNDALLQGGELTVHVVRADDLLTDFTPAHTRSLILERLTHLILRIRLDQEKETLAINDAVLDLGSLAPASQLELGAEPVAAAAPAPIEQPAARVQVIRSEALLLPHGSVDVEGHVLEPQQLAQLADNILPPGIVAAQISIVEESAAPISGANEQGTVSVSLRSYKVFVKITEIERTAVHHDTTIAVPILKVLVESTGANGAKKSIKAFALRPAGPPTAARPQLVAPAKPEGKPEDHQDAHLGSPRPFRGQGRPCRGRHGRPSPPSRFVNWIAKALGFRRPSPHHPHPHHLGPPPHGEHDGPEKPHRPHHGFADKDIEASPIDVEHGDSVLAPHPDAGHHRGNRPHHPHHRQGGKGKKLSYRFKHWARHSPVAFLLVVLLVFVAKIALVGGVAALVVRRIRKCQAAKRERAARTENEEDREVKEKSLVEDDEEQEEVQEKA